MPTCYNQRQSLDLTYDNGDDVTLLTSHRSKFQRNLQLTERWEREDGVGLGRVL